MFVHNFKSIFTNKQAGELFRGSSTAFIIRLAGIAAGYTFTLLVTRALGAEAMGVFALSYTALQVTGLIARGGLDSAMMRLSAELTGNNSSGALKDVYLKGLISILISSTFLFAALYITAPFLSAYVFHKPHLAPFLRIASLGVIPMSLLQLNSGGLRGLKRIWQHSFLSHMSIFLFALITLYILFPRQLDMTAPITALVVALFFSATLSFFLWIRNAPYVGMRRTPGLTIRELLDIGIPLMLAGSMSFIMQWTDTLMLGIFRAEVEVGVYAVVSRVAKLATLTLFAINIIAAPKFAETYGSHDKTRLENVVHQSTRMIFWSSFPMVLLLFLAPTFILGIFGPEFTTGVPALYILTSGQLIWTISGLVGTILAMTGHQHTLRNIMLFATVLNILLNLVLIPPFGINGAAIATAIGLAAWNLIGILFVKKHLNITSFYFPLFRRKSS